MLGLILLMRGTVISALGALLIGCAVAEHVRVKDHNSPTASVRVTMRPEALARNPESLRGFQLGYERYRAKGTQELQAGQNVYFVPTGPSVTGPDTLHNEATVEQTHLAYTHTFLFGPKFELEPMLGAVYLRFDTTVEPMMAASRPSLRYSGTQFYGGIVPRWRFNDFVALELRVAATAKRSDINVGGTDFGVVLRPDRRVGVWLGYSWRSGGGNLDGVSSMIDLRARGPAASLVFDF